jgi:O-antigen/teichoic acid export membrane protein
MSILKFGEERRGLRPLGQKAAIFFNARAATIRSLRRVADKASWTLLDQCTVSAGNFLLNVLLARALGQDDYGKFALFLGAIFTLRNIDWSLISYPLSLRLCVAKAEHRAGLLGATVLLAAGLSLGLMAIMGLGIALLGAIDLLLPACLCYLCWQAQETSRRCLLADFRYREAVAGDAVAYVGQALLVAVMLRVVPVTLSSTLYVMSATFALGALVHGAKLHVTWPKPGAIWGLPREYFSVGKWSLITYQLVLLRVQLFPWLLATIAGTAATASLQASFNIVNVMNPVILGIGNTVPQIAAHAHRSSGIRGAVRAVYAYVLFGLAPILVICFAGVLLPDPLLRAVYGPASPYLAAAFCLQLLMVAGVLDYVAEMISKTLLGVQSGKLAFLINVISVLAALGLALVFIEPLGVLGACLALLAANLVRVVSAVISMIWLIGHDRLRKKAGEQLADTGDVEQLG